MPLLHPCNLKPKFPDSTGVWQERSLNKPAEQSLCFVDQVRLHSGNTFLHFQSIFATTPFATFAEFTPTLSILGRSIQSIVYFLLPRDLTDALCPVPGAVLKAATKS